MDEACLPGRKRKVALLAEGVDRNIKNKPAIPKAVVALLAEGVDRNPKKERLGLAQRMMSPSSRRAWIEITSHS